MIHICPVCESEIKIPEIDGALFECPRCKNKLQAFNIGGFWEVHRSMGKFSVDDIDEE